MRDLSIDIETYSSVSLKDCGAYKYAESEDFEILLFGYSVDFAEPECIDLACGEVIPAEIVIAMFDPRVTKRAFNAQFEWICLSKYFGLDRAQSLDWIRQWRDTMIHAYYLGYAGGLEMVGDAVGLPEDKKKLSTGKALIRYFSCPVKPTKSNGMRTRNYPHHDPEKWKLYKEYNIGDVVAEMNIFKKLRGIEVPEFIWGQWFTDIKINSRGVPMDHELIVGAIECDRIDREKNMQEFRSLTGLANPASNAQLLGWLNSEGFAMENMQKATVTDTLKRDDLPENIRTALELKQEVSKTSIRKFNKMLDYECKDGRARGIIQFYGASSTGRYSGRGIQLQNLKRCYLSDLDTPRDLAKQQNYAALSMFYDSVSDTLSQLIRTAFIPSDGRILLDADFSAIEARVLSILAGEQWIIDEFNGEGKLYEATASQIFGVPKELIKKGTKYYKLRQQGKVASLSCQYQGSVAALTKMDFDNVVPDEMKPTLVEQWRAANPNIVKFWYDIENACKDTIGSGRKHKVGEYIETELISYSGIKYLKLNLPSGRGQFYSNPSIGTNRFGKPSICYMGKDQVTGKWGARETYGGSLTEGVTQAVARDLLAEALERLEENGYEVLFHVHDEAIVDWPSVSVEDDKKALERMYEIMSVVPDWFSAMPLKSDGWSGYFYKKD